MRAARMRSSLRSRHRHRSHPVAPNHCGDLLPRFLLPAPAAARLSQYTQQSRFVNGRAFFQNGNQWIDSNAQNTAKRQRVQFNSEEYFNLLTKHPEAGPWLALGQNVVLTLDDTVYEIAE